jgi:uncharacterized protein YaaW (UPF0174 family)
MFWRHISNSNISLLGGQDRKTFFFNCEVVLQEIQTDMRQNLKLKKSILKSLIERQLSPQIKKFRKTLGQDQQNSGWRKD